MAKEKKEKRKETSAVKYNASGHCRGRRYNEQPVRIVGCGVCSVLDGDCMTVERPPAASAGLNASATSLSASESAAAAASAAAECSDAVVLVAGQHGFQFDYTLPSDLPSSYEGRWGSVRYGVKATLSRPGRFDIERDAELNVTAHLDLNQDPELAVSNPPIFQTD